MDPTSQRVDACLFDDDTYMSAKKEPEDQGSEASGETLPAEKASGKARSGKGKGRPRRGKGRSREAVLGQASSSVSGSSSLNNASFDDSPPDLSTSAGVC